MQWYHRHGVAIAAGSSTPWWQASAVVEHTRTLRPLPKRKAFSILLSKASFLRSSFRRTGGETFGGQGAGAGGGGGCGPVVRNFG